MLEELETRTTKNTLHREDVFLKRHIGSNEADLQEMLALLGLASLDQLTEETVPASIRLDKPLALSEPRTEEDVVAELRQIASKNQVFRSFIGCGYANTFTPMVIQRNILENPGWYTQYTPYQAEISQGRLEALLNFQTLITDLTGLSLANSSLLDEGTAAAEAMAMCKGASRSKGKKFFAGSDCHPQTLAVLQTRAVPLGIEIEVGDVSGLNFPDGEDGYFGVLVQYPTTDGRIQDPRPIIERAHAAGALVVLACDLLALTLLASPGELGADIAVGSAQRFGVPLGYGGPHAAFLATSDDYKRLIPGRIVGLSKDAAGRPALRLALQTREQHIRRAKATSNICTAQVLLAIMASMYAVYHGPEGLRRIARRTHLMARTLAAGLAKLGYDVPESGFFDTVAVRPGKNAADSAPGFASRIRAAAEARKYNIRVLSEDAVSVALDETTSAEDLRQLFAAFAGGREVTFTPEELVGSLSATTTEDSTSSTDNSGLAFGPSPLRKTDYLTHEVFHLYHTEHELLRYLHRLQAKDLSLTTSMIPLGSCTMKLNATAEMVALSWPEFASLHPFAPKEQAAGYWEMFSLLETWLAEITGFAATSLQPNAGAQGEYTGLLVIREYHVARGEGHRDVCLIPDSAHGTNPASAVMAGFRVVAVKCDSLGNIDVADLREKATKHANELSALMVTYPSTHGVFEESIREICDVVHENGGQVYMDGANMNAQVGLCRPGDFGADVCHLNLHKTFCIPHGGGGPGMGPICVAKHLAPHLPSHPFVDPQGRDASSGAIGGVPGSAGGAIGPVSAAPFGSASILTISWTYIAMMGAAGLRRASQVAILNANYLARRLDGPYKILYKGAKGRVAHEFILDTRPFKASADIGVDDIAKRLIDYGYHAPTMSFPVAGTLMIEPTESESKAELDKFCDAMLQIRKEIASVEAGEADRADNVLHRAPHPAEEVISDSWDRPYSRELAAYPLPYLRQHKFWTPVSRVDNAYGDRNLICTCPPMDAYAEGAE